MICFFFFFFFFPPPWPTCFSPPAATTTRSTRSDFIGQLLDTMVRPAKPKQAVRPVRDRWDSEREYRELEDGVSPSSSGPLTGTNRLRA